MTHQGIIFQAGMQGARSATCVPVHVTQISSYETGKRNVQGETCPLRVQAVAAHIVLRGKSQCCLPVCFD